MVHSAISIKEARREFSKLVFKFEKRAKISKKNDQVVY